MPKNAETQQRRAWHLGYCAGFRRGVDRNRFTRSDLSAAYFRGYDAGVAAYSRSLLED